MNSKKTFLSQNQLNYSQEHKNSIEQSPSTNKTQREPSPNRQSIKSSGISRQSSGQQNSSSNISKNSMQAGYSNSSSNSEKYPFIQGLVQYDAQQIILEESKSQFEISADDFKIAKKPRKNGNPSSGMLSRFS